MFSASQLLSLSRHHKSLAPSKLQILLPKSFSNLCIAIFKKKSLPKMLNVFKFWFSQDIKPSMLMFNLHDKFTMNWKLLESVFMWVEPLTTLTRFWMIHFLEFPHVVCTHKNQPFTPKCFWGLIHRVSHSFTI